MTEKKKVILHGCKSVARLLETAAIINSEDHGGRAGQYIVHIDADRKGNLVLLRGAIVAQVGCRAWQGLGLIRDQMTAGELAKYIIDSRTLHKHGIVGKYEVVTTFHR